MVFEIGEASQAETVMREKLKRREQLMGFGHRVYRTRDPRAEVLSLAAEGTLATCSSSIPCSAQHELL